MKVKKEEVNWIKNRLKIMKVKKEEVYWIKDE